MADAIAPGSPGGARILFVRTDACTFDPRVRKEAGSLAAAGYRVEVFGWDRRGEFPRREEIDGAQYLRSRIRAPYGSPALALLLPLFWLRTAAHIVKTRPAVVHACDFDALLPALFSRPFTRCRIVYDIFDTYAQKVGGLPDGLRRLVDKIDRALMKRVDAVLVADDHRAQQISGVQVRRLEVIMNVPPKGEAPSRPHEGGALRLCYAGSIHEQRGLHLIAGAIHGMAQVETTFAGWIPRPADGDFLRAQSHIRYLGKLDYGDALALIRESDVVLALYDPRWPINRMASSNKVFEAMAAGRPVITNEETTMAQIVREEQCGCLVPYGDESALRGAIEDLRSDPALRGRMGTNGYRAFRERYHWGIMEARLKELYGRVLAS